VWFKPVNITIARGMEYESAGCLFTDKQSFLAGFQRKQQRWTSFGGKKYHGETAFMTAMREVIEELFEVSITQKTLTKLICSINFSFPIQDETYIYYIYPYEVIFQLIDILYEDGYQSPLYDEWPSSLSELIHKRKTNESSEMEHIQIFYKTEIQDIHHALDDFFYKDLMKLFSDFKEVS
jgi:hypothetical protein